MVIVPVRRAPVVFAAMLNWTDPPPLPVAPAVSVIHGTLLEAVHVQPALAVTVTVPLPPACATSCEEGAIANVHPVSWLTVTVCPAIVAVPLLTGPVFAS